MYYNSMEVTPEGGSKKWVVSWAISNDGVAFKKKGKILFKGGGGKGDFDEGGMSRRHGVEREEGGAYDMFYEAVDGNRKHSIGLATSEDGISWQVRGCRSRGRCGGFSISCSNNDGNTCPSSNSSSSCCCCGSSSSSSSSGSGGDDGIGTGSNLDSGEVDG